jgi:hypothetical protein
MDADSAFDWYNRESAEILSRRNPGHAMTD